MDLTPFLRGCPWFYYSSKRYINSWKTTLRLLWNLNKVSNFSIRTHIYGVLSCYPEYSSVLDRESEILVYPLSYSKFCSHWLCQITVEIYLQQLKIGNAIWQPPTSSNAQVSKANPGELVLLFWWILETYFENMCDWLLPSYMLLELT